MERNLRKKTHEQKTINFINNEVFSSEAMIQNLVSDLYVDISDVKDNYKYERFKKMLLNTAQT